MTKRAIISLIIIAALSAASVSNSCAAATKSKTGTAKQFAKTGPIKKK